MHRFTSLHRYIQEICHSSSFLFCRNIRTYASKQLTCWWNRLCKSFPTTTIGTKCIIAFSDRTNQCRSSNSKDIINSSGWLVATHHHHQLGTLVRYASKKRNHSTNLYAKLCATQNGLELTLSPPNWKFLG